MLSAWTEILPLLIVKWLARRYCEVAHCRACASDQMFAIARPDVLVKLKNKGGAE